MICPMMSYHAGSYGGSQKICIESKCAFWSTRYKKCSITAIAEEALLEPVHIDITETTETVEYVHVPRR